ncbi:MAG: hypothetical protein V4615_09490 [Bacteroidota bacterium]
MKSNVKFRTPGKKIFLALAITLFGFIFLIGGCKKDKDDEGLTTIYKLKTHSQTSGGTTSTRTYYYDSLGRVDSIWVFIENTITSSPRFTYYTDSIVERVNDIFTATYYLTNGYATSRIGRTPWGVGSSITYTYDAEGHLLSQNAATTFGWGGGNMINESRDGAVTHYYNYSPNSVNTIGNRNKGMSFLGIESRNLVNTITSATSNLSHHVSYTFDSQNRVAEARTDTFLHETFTYY